MGIDSAKAATLVRRELRFSGVSNWGASSKTRYPCSKSEHVLSGSVAASEPVGLVRFGLDNNVCLYMWIKFVFEIDLVVGWQVYLLYQTWNVYRSINASAPHRLYCTVPIHIFMRTAPLELSSIDSRHVCSVSFMRYTSVYCVLWFFGHSGHSFILDPIFRWWLYSGSFVLFPISHSHCSHEWHHFFSSSICLSVGGFANENRCTETCFNKSPS